MAKKRAIADVARPAGFWDDAAKQIAKTTAPQAKKLGTQFARTATKRREMKKTARMAAKHMEIMKKSGQRWGGGK